MYIALDRDGIRVSIDKAEADKEYFCPLCNGKLMQKKGQIRVHHFAHDSRSKCDGWTYDDMSEWHREWQNRFPVECREIVIVDKGEKHRADICINDSVVIEFQHSSMSNDEFKRRNTFYSSAGYKVVWLFDMIEPYEEERIEPTVNPNKYHWKWAAHTFDGYKPNYSKTDVYFQFCIGEDEYYGIEKLAWRSPDNKVFITEDDLAYNEEEFVECMNDLAAKSRTVNHKLIENTTDTQSLFDIISRSRKRVIVVQNVNNHRIVKIGISNITHTPCKLYGYFATNTGGFYSDRREVFFAGNKEWILLWESDN